MLLSWHNNIVSPWHSRYGRGDTFCRGHIQNLTVNLNLVSRAWFPLFLFALHCWDLVSFKVKSQIANFFLHSSIRLPLHSIFLPPPFYIYPISGALSLTILFITDNFPPAGPSARFVITAKIHKQEIACSLNTVSSQGWCKHLPSNEADHVGKVQMEIELFDAVKH